MRQEPQREVMGVNASCQMRPAAAGSQYEYHRARCVEIVTVHVIPGASRRVRALRGPNINSAGELGLASNLLRTDPEHGDCAAILRPAGNIITDRDRPLFTVGDGPHALALDAARDQIVAHRLRATRTYRNIVLARPALVGVALNRELRILTVVGEPLRLLVESRPRLRR